MAAVLLAGTGLMTRSFQALVDTDPGFDSADVWALRFQINAAEGPARLAEDRQRLLFGIEPNDLGAFVVAGVVGLVISPIDPYARYRRTKTAWKSSRRWS